MPDVLNGDSRQPGHRASELPPSALLRPVRPPPHQQRSITVHLVPSSLASRAGGPVDLTVFPARSR